MKRKLDNERLEAITAGATIETTTTTVAKWNMGN